MSEPMRFTFNGSIRVEGQANRLTENAGGLLLRELDDRLGLTSDLAEKLVDPRNPDCVTHSLVELLRSRLIAMALGHKDQDDLDRLREDPALRVSVSERRGTAPMEEADGLAPNGLASQPTQSRLVAALSSEENLATLSLALFWWAKRDIVAARQVRARRTVLDVDSLPIEAHGIQPGSANNAYYHCRCFHPICVFDYESGHCFDGKLRPGNVGTADGVIDFLLPIVDRTKAENLAQHVDVRGDCGFVSEPLLGALEGREVHYVFLVRKNAVLERMATPYLKRPAGRPPSEPRVWTHELEYKAEPWSRVRRVVLVVLEQPGELFLDHFFLVTNWTAAERTGEELLEFYRQRGTMERYLGEFKSVLEPALSSTNRPKSHVRGKPPKNWFQPINAEAANEATFYLYLLAYNLLNAARRTMNRSGGTRGRRRSTKTGVSFAGDDRWSLDRLRNMLLRVAARVTQHSRYLTFQINDTAEKLWKAFRRGLGRLNPQLC